MLWSRNSFWRKHHKFCVLARLRLGLVAPGPSNFVGEQSSLEMDASGRREDDVSVGLKNDQVSACLGRIFRHSEGIAVGRCQHYGLFAFGVHKLHAIAALCDNAFDIIRRNIGSVVLSARSVVYAVPNRSNDEWPLRIAIFKDDSYLVARLRHKHESTIGTGVGTDSTGPVSRAVLLPEELYLDPAHLLGIIVIHHSRRNNSAPGAGQRRLWIPILLPRRTNKAVAVTLSRPPVDHLHQAVGPLGIQSTFKLHIVAGFRFLFPYLAFTCMAAPSDRSLSSWSCV